MREVKSVELVLENCESIKFLPDQIGIFCCDKITSYVARVACNSISKQLICEWMCIELYNSANQKYNSLGQESEDRALDRLGKFNDITAVEVTYEDGGVDYILVPWNEENDYSNKYQTSYVADDNSLRILVSKEQNAKDFFARGEEQ
ncbi:MAG: hypothetical protein NC548_61465 [Lachnospiraceae bacterium]|nr:hypothetical protein [Lachnospiraceae bacterium]